MPDAKEFLEQIDCLLAKIETKQEKIAMTKALSLEKELMQECAELTNEVRRIETVVNQVKNGDQIRVLHKRYWSCEPWDRIALDMKKSVSSVKEIGKAALQSVQAILDKKG